MSQSAKPEQDEDMLPEYDFAHGVRGKHHRAYQDGTNVLSDSWQAERQLGR